MHYGFTYLASPYSHSDPAVQEQRFRAACAAAAKLMSLGYVIFSPIAHTHPIALAGNLPRGWDFWESQDQPLLEAATRLWVLTIDGWEQSKGIAAEIQFMRAKVIKPIAYLNPEATAIQYEYHGSSERGDWMDLV